MAVASLKDLFDAGVHFGHPTNRWNPKMKPYIYMARSKIHIIDLEKSASGLQEACDFARDLAQWTERILTWFADRVLPMDAAAARRWGRLSASVGNRDVDLLIAATALEHGLTVVTRNLRHFEPAGVPVLDPFGSETAGSAP